MSPEELEKIVDQILAENPDKVKQLQGLLKKTAGNLMGQILKENPKFNPILTMEILKKKLNED